MTAYTEIQSKLAGAFGDDRSRSDAAFGSFISTIESHDSEVRAAIKKGRALHLEERSASPALSDSDERQPEFDGEPVTKRFKVDESAYPWVKNRQEKRTVLRDTLAKTLRLIKLYTVDPKATKRSLVNEPDCPEFPDSEWKNVIAGRSVNLDAVLSGQLSTTHDDPKVEKFSDLEITFGAVEPMKLVKDGGDRTSVHSRVIVFDKAVRKRVGGVRNLELCDFEKFSDLKIVHMDLIGVFVVSGTSKDDGGRKGKHNKNWKKDEPCNKWNDGKCAQEEENCRRLHICNKCHKGGHKGKDCPK